MRKSGKSGATKRSAAASIPNNPNALYLVIVESPSKCKKIEEYLGSNYMCIASKGHIRTIDGIKSIDVKNNYSITFSVIEEKKGHVAEMNKIICQFPQSSIYLATDDDREGEAIAWHICEMFALPVSTTKRILFHEITKPAITAAITHPTTINMSLVYAQHARQVLDILVGYKISPTLWKNIHNNKKNGLSAGRCQTPALRLVYENDKENKQEFELKWKTAAYFFSTNTKFELTHDFVHAAEVEQFLEKSKTHEYKMSVGIPRESVKHCPRPFNTSQLLQTASNVLHYSPKMTMDLCQQLYQAGFITYMRTDSTKYSPVFIASATAYIISSYGATFLGNALDKITNNDNANPHEAIRVTNLATTVIDGDKILQSMYRLIWKNTVESCMADAKCNVTKVKISAPSFFCVDEQKEKTAGYETDIEVITFYGWKKACMAINDTSETEEKTKANTLIMYLQSICNKNEAFTYTYVDCSVTVKHRHSHYTEAFLIQKLEELGIGRPSTFATIVDTIQERGYVKKKDISGITIECDEYKLRGNIVEKTKKAKEFGAEKGKLQIQPTGIVAIEFLVEYFESLFSYGYTKNMEESLDVIAQEQDAEKSKNEWWKVCDNCLTEIKQLLKHVAKLEKPKYMLNDGYEVVFHQYGASLKRICDAETGEVEYKAIKKGIQIDMEKLKRGEYTAEELMELKNDILGIYEFHEVKLKNGMYGKYVVWNDKKISLSTLHKSIDSIELDDVIPFIQKKIAEEKMVDVFGETVELSIDLSTISDSYRKTVSQGTSIGNNQDISSGGIVRVFNSSVSIRNGKYGNYVFYKTGSMKKPVFYGLKEYHGNAKTCDYDEIKEFVKNKHKATLP
jgi:DNA topoisomerase-1